MMTEENLARLRTHRNNIHRYRGLLRTQLTDLERGFIETRISEEMEAAKRQIFPFAFRLPAQQSASDDPVRSLEAWSWMEGDLNSRSLPLPAQSVDATQA
jgi:hypothetical protein